MPQTLGSARGLCWAAQINTPLLLADRSKGWGIVEFESIEEVCAARLRRSEGCIL